MAYIVLSFFAQVRLLFSNLLIIDGSYYPWTYHNSMSVVLLLSV